MKLTDETLHAIKETMKPGFYIPPWDMPLPDTIHALATEVLESRAEIERRIIDLDAAIHALGEWARKAGTFEVRVAELEGVAVDVMASLAAAISLLERGGKKAAASDKMFAQMLVDYNASLACARAALRRDEP